MSKRSGEALKALFLKAVAAHQAGNAAEAERLYTKVLQSEPEQFDALHLIRNREIDIAVDLMGFTQGNRMGVLAHRPAPVHVNYLGYAGTSGADFLDYILADAIVIPEDSPTCFSEHVVRLADHFFAHSARKIAQDTPERGELGLPEKGYLFLDTLPYNGHTTTSDALLAGLPVLTCMGRTLAGGVAGSLLNAAGIPELATDSLEAYESLALRLATEPELLSSIRARLASNLSTFPLFDRARFTRSLEAAYVRMWERSERGEPSAAISL